MAKSGGRRKSALNDPKVRGLVIQVVLVAALIAFVAVVASNTVENLRRSNIAYGFDFLGDRAGFGISQALIPYSPESTYGRAFLVGLLNTLLVAITGIVLTTVLGFIIGIARLSTNWLIARLAGAYVEIIRNVPLLLLLLFFYRAVLAVLPGPRQAANLGFGANLSNRGLALPRPIFGPEIATTGTVLLVAVVFAVGLFVWTRRRQAATGLQFPAIRIGLAVVLIAPVAAFVVSGAALDFDYPVLKGFNFVGGWTVQPEFMALVISLVMYTATFIAEIVRAGILSVARGQTEAAEALGLRSGTTLRLVVIPQALRVIVPPLTNQYLNLTKNSSLAVAVGYPDLVAVFAGTVLVQTGQAIEVIFITMLVYLAISLFTASVMGLYNRSIALVER
jgi:general L-amino acid transport system permease protein